MTTTTNLGITLVEQSQAQKEVTINQALTCLDAMVGSTVADKDLATPPVSPTPGMVYIVGASPTGEWAGKATALAYFDQVWRFITAVNGMRVFVRDESQYYQFNGTAWVIVITGGDMLKATYDPGNVAQQVVGVSAAQTLTNKTISGTSNTLTVRLANDVTGALPVSNGGTGQTSYTDGQVLIGNSTGGTLTKTTLTAGSGIAITNAAGAITIAATGGAGITPMIACGRLTLTSATPVTTANVTLATTVYFTPYKGNRIALFDGTSAWTLLSFNELSIAVPATVNTMYDVFAYNNAGAVALELLAWTNDTTRATALVAQDGVYVRSGATTRRYLGSFRTVATSGRTEDSRANRYVWNYYNRVLRLMQVFDPAASWTYSTATLRQANANTANQLNFIIGVAEDVVNATVRSEISSSTATMRYPFLAIGLDSVTTRSSDGLQGGASVSNTLYADIIASYSGVPAAGRRYLSWLEGGAGIDTQTWYANSVYSGIHGTVFA